jgi:hypothetical protein
MSMTSRRKRWCADQRIALLRQPRSHRKRKRARTLRRQGKKPPPRRRARKRAPRARSRLISLWELIQDAFGDLLELDSRLWRTVIPLELDSRLWRTVIPLLVRPGQLTRDYLEGRRARYMPPFRMYLVLSVVFFVVAFFDPRDDLSLLFEAEPEPIPEETSQIEEETKSEAQAVLDDLAEEGLISEDQAKVLPNDDPETGECTLDDAGFEQMPQWVRKRLTRERLEGICERISADGAKTFTGLLVDNIPVALIVLLPFMALVLKALYPLSRRYFVEHLLFFVHTVSIIASVLR